MALYEIRTYRAGRLSSTITRKRRDAAALVFERAVYDALASYGRLDTRYGHGRMSIAKRAREAHQGIVSVAFDLIDLDLHFVRIR